MDKNEKTFHTYNLMGTYDDGNMMVYSYII